MENMETSNSTYIVQYNRDHAGIIAFQAFIFIMVEIVGNFTLLAFILHEKYGMDPQKRTMSNQIMSSICACFIIFNLMLLPIWFTYRVYYFDIVWIKVIVVYGLAAVVTFTFLALAEMVLIKLFYIFFFHKTIDINEDFGTLILTLFKIIFVSIGVLVKVVTKEYLSNPFILEVNHGTSYLHWQIIFYTTRLPCLISIIVILVGLPTIYFKKMKASRQEHQRSIALSLIQPSISTSNEAETRIEMPLDNSNVSNDNIEEPPNSTIINVKPWDQKDSDNEETHEVAINDNEEQQEPLPTVVAVEQQQVPVFNTSKSNENLIGQLGIILSCISLITIIMPIIFSTHYKIGMFDIVSMYVFVSYSIMITVMPLSYFLKRPRKFLDVCEMFGLYFN